MQFSTRAITGFRAIATDGDMGRIQSFIFDDRDWTVCHITVRAGLMGPIVPVDPRCVDLIDGAKKRIYFNQTKAGLLLPPPEHGRRAPDSHPRNTNEVAGYDVEAVDGRIGAAADMVVDTAAWKIHELVIRDGWLFGVQRVASMEQVQSIDWTTHTVRLNVGREAILSGRRFDPKAPVNTVQEVRTIDYAGEAHLVSREQFAK